MFAFQLILVILIVSGLIAYIGDKVGRYIGRKRLSFLRLRPRYTAITITVFTGALIALLTGIVLFSVSSDVRTAFFGLDKLKKLISERTVELDKIKADRQELLSEIEKLNQTVTESRKEIELLLKTKDNLTNEIMTARSGNLLYRVGDVITFSVISPTGDPDTTRGDLTKLLAETDDIIRKMVGTSKKQLISMPESELDEAVKYIEDHKGGVVARILAASNIVIGEEIPVHFELIENRLVLKKGEVVSTALINGEKKVSEIEQDIKQLLAQVNNIAMRKGIIPDAEGSVGQIPYSRIFEVSKSISARKKSVRVNVVSESDTYAVGPLDIELQQKD